MFSAVGSRGSTVNMCPGVWQEGNERVTGLGFEEGSDETSASRGLRVYLTLVIIDWWISNYG